MNLIDQLRRDEGLRLTPYKDTEGIWTVGYGHNLECHGNVIPISVSVEEAETWLVEDAALACKAVRHALPWTEKLDPARCDVLNNMCFNMGINALLGFHRTLAMIEAGNYEGAAAAMMESRWAAQVGKRAERLSKQMETGEYQ